MTDFIQTFCIFDILMTSHLLGESLLGPHENNINSNTNDV